MYFFQCVNVILGMWAPGYCLLIHILISVLLAYCWLPVVWNTASSRSWHVAALKLLLLDTCVSYQADTSRIVHQSHTATCLAILLIHKSEIKLR